MMTTHTEDTRISPVNCNTTAGSGHFGDITYTVGGVRFTMKPIPAVANGIIGDNLDGDNKPHTVSLTAYLIGETQVTQELWQAVMGNNPSFFTGSSEGTEIQCQRPVECINWYCALAFCNKLSILLGLESCYTVIKNRQPIDFAALTVDAIPSSHDSDWNNAVLDMSKNGFRLPTEAEWEWAARGGATGDNSTWGIAEIEAPLEEYAWTLETGDCKTHEVKKKKPNGYGVYDMIGNVWEWCWNWYDENTPAAGQTDPLGVADGTDRTFRGGSWGDDAYDATAAVRRAAKPEDDNFTIGFRLAVRRNDE